jgi:hypothetical protein
VKIEAHPPLTDVSGLYRMKLA